MTHSLRHCLDSLRFGAPLDVGALTLGWQGERLRCIQLSEDTAVVRCRTAFW